MLPAPVATPSYAECWKCFFDVQDPTGTMNWGGLADIIFDPNTGIHLDTLNELVDHLNPLVASVGEGQYAFTSAALLGLDTEVAKIVSGLIQVDGGGGGGH